MDNPLKSDFAEKREKIVWVRYRRWSRLPVPANRKGLILVYATYAILFAWLICTFLQPPQWILWTLIGMFAVCGILLQVFSESAEE